MDYSSSLVVLHEEQDRLASVSVSDSPLGLVSGKMFYNSSGSTWLTVHNLQLWMINGKKSTFQPLPSLPLGCTLIFPVKVWWKAQLDVWMWGFIQTHSVQQLQAACRCFVEPTSKSDKNANIIGFCNILIFGSRGLRSGLGDKALKEDQVYFPRHIRGTSVVQGIYGVNCVIPQPMGCPIKASHAVDLPPHYFPAWAPYMRLGPCFVVVSGSPLACTGSGALGLTEPQNRPCQRRPAGLLEEPWRVCGLLS